MSFVLLFMPVIKPFRTIGGVVFCQSLLKFYAPGRWDWTKWVGTLYTGARGSLVVKALRYKAAGRGFDSRWCHWNFSVT